RAHAHFTTDDMLKIQLDDRALFLERWKDLMVLELNRAPHTAERDALLKALAGWKGRASVDSVAYRVVRAWRDDVIDTVLGGFAAAGIAELQEFALPKLPQAEHAVRTLLRERPAHLVAPGYADGNALLIACADRPAAALDQQPGGIAARTWGEHNTMRIAHPV